MKCKALILMVMIIAVQAKAQFIDPLEKATLDYYYDSKTNSIDGARIVDKSITTNKFAAMILDLWLPRDGSKAMQAGLPMGGFKITNLGAPTAPTDATTKAYVDNSFTNIFSGPGTTGLVTSVAAETNRFLRGDGAWSAPSGSGDFLRDGTISMTGPLNFGGNKGTNVANGTISNDVASLWQVWNATNTLWSTILGYGFITNMTFTDWATDYPADYADYTNTKALAASALQVELDPVWSAESNLYYRASNPSNYVTASVTNDLYSFVTNTYMPIAGGTFTGAVYVSTATATNSPVTLDQLGTHTNATGTSVHGLGTISTRASNDFYLASNPSNYVTASITNTLGTYAYQTGNLALGTNWLSGDGDSEGIQVDANGNVGIGTNVPQNTMHIHAPTNVVRLMLTCEGGTAPSATMGGLHIVHTPTNSYIINRETGFMAFYTDNAEQMRITSAGYVGIGLDSPSAHLDVDGVMHLTEYGGVALYRCRRINGTLGSPTALVSGNTIGGILGAGFNGSAVVNDKIGVLMSAAENWTTNATGSQMTFETTPLSTNARSVAVNLRPDRDLRLYNMPAGKAPTTASGYSVIASQTNEMYVWDGAGNRTLISPHNANNDLVKRSDNRFTGVEETINLTKLAIAIEQLLPKDNPLKGQIYSVITNTPTHDWREEEAKVKQASTEQIQAWEASEEKNGAKPEPYIERAIPIWATERQKIFDSKYQEKALESIDSRDPDAL